MEWQRNRVLAPCFLSCQICSPPPFSSRPLSSNADTAIVPSKDELLSLLPASYRTTSDDLVAASRNVQACIEQELDLGRLNKVSGWLWIAGRPMPPRPLHHQVLLSRDIFITEQMDMHLVWTTGRMFLKPVPRFLLEPHFWTCYLSCGHSCRCPTDVAECQERFPKSGHVPERVPQPTEHSLEHPAEQVQCRQMLWKSALGFLFSYAALITHESDFQIAKEKLLLPPEVTWPAWRSLVHQLDTEHIYPNISHRFVYGELRLSRLNYLSQTPLRGYTPRWQQYGSFFQDNFAWLASATIYIAVVLTAMQVGLATDALGGNAVFQSVSYGFTVFAILGPIIASGLIIIAFCLLFVNNWLATTVYRKKRLRYIQK